MAQSLLFIKRISAVTHSPGNLHMISPGLLRPPRLSVPNETSRRTAEEAANILHPGDES